MGSPALSSPPVHAGAAPQGPASDPSHPATGGSLGVLASLSSSPPAAMKIKLRNSKQKKAKKTGFLTRQRTKGGRKVNKRQRARHGAF